MGFQIEDGVLTKYTEEPGVTEVVIPEGVTKIGDGAFYGCTSPKRVVIPEDVRTIGQSAFSGCKLLTEVVIPDSVTEIGVAAFCASEMLQNVTIPDGVTEIAYAVFYGCTSLRRVTIPESVTEIGISVFSGCVSLTEVVIPDSVRIIGMRAFYDCKSLESVVIPDSVMEFGSGVFSGCFSLRSLTLLGYMLDVSEWYRYNVTLHDIKKMLTSKDYSYEMAPEIKYRIVAQVFLRDGQPEAERFIRENVCGFIQYFIGIEDYKTVRALFACGKFVTAENSVTLADYAISHTAEGGNVEIQAYILDYRKRHFPDADPLGGLNF